MAAQVKGSLKKQGGNVAPKADVPRWFEDVGVPEDLLLDWRHRQRVFLAGVRKSEMVLVVLTTLNERGDEAVRTRASKDCGLPSHISPHSFRVTTMTLRGITTDGSSLHPEAIATVFGKIPHQICTLHVLREITKAILSAVAKVRNGGSKRGGEKKGSGKGTFVNIAVIWAIWRSHSVSQE